MRCFTSSNSHSTTNSCSTIENPGVRAIGLKSAAPVMGVVLGTGVMLASFHCIGNIPDDSGRLKMLVTGSARSGANSFRRRAGTPSGPGDLKVHKPNIILRTAVVDMIGGCSGDG